MSAPQSDITAEERLAREISEAYLPWPTTVKFIRSPKGYVYDAKPGIIVQFVKGWKQQMAEEKVKISYVGNVMIVENIQPPTPATLSRDEIDEITERSAIRDEIRRHEADFRKEFRKWWFKDNGDDQLYAVKEAARGLIEATGSYVKAKWTIHRFLKQIEINTQRTGKISKIHTEDLSMIGLDTFVPALEYLDMP